MKNRVLLGELIAEYLGSMFLVMAAISSMILFCTVFDSTKSIAVVANALAVAFVLFALIEMFAPVSGAHFNPVVTMVMFFNKKISRLKALLYVAVQIIGGITGAIFSHLMFFEKVSGLLSVSQIVRTNYLYFSEVLATFILVLAILVLVRVKSDKIPLVVGFLVGGQLLATSSTMFANPQVTIARIFTDSAAGIRPEDAAVFIIMQIIGATLAYLVYKHALEKSIDQKMKEAN